MIYLLVLLLSCSSGGAAGSGIVVPTRAKTVFGSWDADLAFSSGASGEVDLKNQVGLIDQDVDNRHGGHGDPVDATEAYEHLKTALVLGTDPDKAIALEKLSSLANDIFTAEHIKGSINGNDSTFTWRFTTVTEVKENEYLMLPMSSPTIVDGEVDEQKVTVLLKEDSWPSNITEEIRLTLETIVPVNGATFASLGTSLKMEIKDTSGVFRELVKLTGSLVEVTE